MERYVVELIQFLSKFRAFDAIQTMGALTYDEHIMMAISGVALGFGILNMVFGYRLLRFWMMLFGFIVGATAGFFVTYLSGTNDKEIMVAAAIGAGVFCAVVSFLIYKAGIFIVGAGLGASIGVYVLHPTSSLVFFVCILIGVGVGMLALKFSKAIIITGTSILGGVSAGFSSAWFANLEEMPYGLLMAVIFSVLAIIVQFAFNRTEDDEEDEVKENRKKKKEPQENKQNKRQKDKIQSQKSDDYAQFEFDEEDYERLRRRRQAARVQKPEKETEIHFDLKSEQKKTKGLDDEIKLYPVKREKNRR